MNTAGRYYTPSKKPCVNCSSEIPENANFCMQCGSQAPSSGGRGIRHEPEK